jgi:type I restriction enzyme R subunit
MSDNISRPERETQNKLIGFLQTELGYEYLGNWEYRENNQNLEEAILISCLEKAGCSKDQINRALDQLKPNISMLGKSLYQANKDFYDQIRYGVQVKVDPSKPTETVHLINWENPKANHFAVAEEVTVHGKADKRPDVVLYVNGIALAVIELKNSRKGVEEGIRQNLTNQQPDFIESYFSTAQFLFAGNTSQGLRYGTIGTPAKYYLTWKENEEENTTNKLEKYIGKLCQKDRLLEIIKDFIVFDGGVKKLPRPHQYFAVKEAQKFIARKEGGIIWHTQGSGKSITMVLLAAWILENQPEARVLIVTDRDELDKQIKRVFMATGHTTIKQANSSKDLVATLEDTKDRLICSLVHKFGQKGEEDFEHFIRQLEAGPTKTQGEFYVFVDECHRTQSGRLHRAMKAIIPSAIFIGFTGTPLLKADKATSLEVFGRYIHTYKFNEAVKDGIVLDLVYEARDIDQRLGSQDRVDAWFEGKTQGLNDYQRAELKKRWGTMQKVLSAKNRMDQIVNDIIFDFSIKPRLSNGAGNAILVANNVFEACKYYELFDKTQFKGKCAIVTSYDPSQRDIVNEETGENTETEAQYKYKIYTEILKEVDPKPGKSKTETYEDWAKKKFLEEPAKMRLLIVVDKLLTGFDAPSCTYLYIDKSMQDHGLFQAICRVNRLDGESKTVGHIVDYKGLFPKVEDAIGVYTKELDYDNFAKEDVQILLESRMEKSKRILDDALEALELYCEPVPNPKGELEYIQYFCGNTEIPEDLKEKEQQRFGLYKGVATLIRAFGALFGELQDAGYSPSDEEHIKARVNHYKDLREVIKNASGETIDLKSYEADMRHLLDTYVLAEESKVISPFKDMGLLDIIEKTSLQDAIDTLSPGIKDNKEAVAETIENNVRSKIIKDQLLDPSFYGKMSELLTEIIKQRKAKALEYQEYLERIAELIKDVNSGGQSGLPPELDTQAKRALYHNLGDDSGLAMAVHESILTSKPDAFIGNPAKENAVKKAIYQIIPDVDRVNEIFEIVKAQPEYK